MTEHEIAEFAKVTETAVGVLKLPSERVEVIEQALSYAYEMGQSAAAQVISQRCEDFITMRRGR